MTYCLRQWRLQHLEQTLSILDLRMGESQQHFTSLPEAGPHGELRPIRAPDMLSDDG
ncbi:hypothetical protein P175DRAFT_0533279 [Aspergillus ochraceoroseus IBT 24754]|uniref:Uncharacterized protein n=1 Tax=Aspergillus ochraceoroseus IBT 24754 TaxID=1392256 RepID=A0A2T5LVH2_9EURO|nr:uncharacterized protein P175DRAFT_0533279 [Aspergillus ochraceoroseus IBT 24754]PTU20284.1 hypothetical protein P175DRAFT_0533279 [Aspergillus ochraceoroseus IBT 24754]